MSERKSSRSAKRSRPVVRRKKTVAIVIIGLIVSLVATAGVLARRGSLFKATPSANALTPAATTTSPAAQSQSPQLAKEYIYAGGKLIATEEPSSSCTVPPVPTGLTANPGNAQVTLNWSASAGATSYNVKRSTINGGPYSLIVNVTGTGYTDSGLTNGVTYYYVVSALNGSCESSNSAQVPATPFGDQVGTNNASFVSQSVPSSMTTGQSTSVSVTMQNTGTTTWTAAGNYKLGSQNPQDNTTWGLNRVTLASSVAPGASYTFNFNITAPCAPGTYNFQWRMVQESVEWFGVASTNVAISVTGTCGGGVPAVPNPLTATVSGTTIRLNWTNVPIELGYKIERKVGGGSFSQINIVGENTTVYFDKNLPAGSYTYQVRAYNSNGNSPYTNTASATIGGSGGPPFGATNLTATAVSSSQINLQWTDNSDNEDGFKIQRKTGSGGTYTALASVGPNVTVYSDASGSPSTTYFYKIIAYNAPSGDGQTSNEASATTFAPSPPAAPSDLTATAFSSSQINLNWVRNSTNEESFKIERKTASTAFTEIQSVAAGVTSYSDTNLSASTTYTYRVRAFKAIGGFSGYSNESSATTLANETVLLADDFNDNSLNTSKWSISILSGTQDTTVNVAEVNQRFEIGPLKQNTSGSHYNGILSVNSFDLTGASAYVQAVTTPPSNTSADLMFTLPVDGSNHYRVYVSAGLLKFEKKIGGVKTTIGSITFNAIDHAFWRVRHASSGDQIFFETAPNNGGVPGTWSVRQQVTRDVPITAIKMELKAGTWQSEANAPGTVIFDNFKLSRPAPTNPAPTVTAISPNSGTTAGGTSVTITGTGFATGATVSIGGTAATSVNVASSTSITAVTPAHAAGAVNVVVTNSDGQSGTLANGFTYGAPPAPTVTAVSPTSGPTTGGTSTTITGTGFLSGAAVAFNDVAATNVNVVSSTSITATTPANPAGAVSVRVTNTDNQSGTLANAFTYTSSDTILLAEDFNSASLDSSKWNITILSGTQDTSIGLSQTSGQLQIGPLLQNTSASHYNGISTVNAFDLTGAYGYVQLTQGPSTSTTADAMFTVVLDISNHYRIFVEAGVLKFEKKLSGVKTTIASVTFNATSHAFWRIRHNSADQIVFETAPNNAGVPGSWTAQATVGREITITSIKLELKAGTWQSEANAPGTVKFDNFKLVRPGS